MTGPLWDLTAVEARDVLDRREISAVELAEAHLARIEYLEPKLACHIEVTADNARAQAANADRRIAAGNSAPMTGILVSLKDVLCTIDAPTTAASKILRGYRSPYDATVVKRLRDQD